MLVPVGYLHQFAQLVGHLVDYRLFPPFHHKPDDQFGAGWPDQDSAGSSEFVSTCSSNYSDELGVNFFPESHFLTLRFGEFRRGIDENIHGDTQVEKIEKLPWPLDKRQGGIFDDNEVDIGPEVRFLSGKGSEDIGRKDILAGKVLPQQCQQGVPVEIDYRYLRPAFLQKLVTPDFRHAESARK